MEKKLNWFLIAEKWKLVEYDFDIEAKTFGSC